MMDRILSCLVALSLALLVWLYARSRDQEILDNVPIPVRITLAEGQAENYSLEITGATQVLVSFSGRPSCIRELRGMVQRNELHVAVTLTVPEDRLSESRYSDTVVIEASDVPVPPGVTPLIVEGRNRVPVTVHHLVERRLPVHFDTGGDEPAGPLLIEPSTVLVRGPQEILDRAQAISTLPAPLPTRPAGAPLLAPAMARVPLRQVLEDRPVRVTPNKVMVRVPPRRHKNYELADVPVRFLCPPDFPFRPRFRDEQAGRVTLQVEGPIWEGPPKANAFVDLTHGTYHSGPNSEPLRIQLPPDFQLAKEPPRTVTFELLPAGAVPKREGVSEP
jgi:hypothetical protein